MECWLLGGRGRPGFNKYSQEHEPKALNLKAVPVSYGTGTEVLSLLGCSGAVSDVFAGTSF